MGVSQVAAGGGYKVATGAAVSNPRVQRLHCIPPTVSATAIHAAAAMGAGGTVSTGITQPSVPCVLSVTGSAAAGTGNVVITGTDVNGAALTDTIALNNASTVQGTKVFKTVTSYTVPSGGAETVAVGVTKKIGLNHALPHDTTTLKLFNNATDAGTVTANSSIVAGNFYAIAGTPDGVKSLDVYYYA